MPCLVKLEVLGDPQTLFPHAGTLKAAEILVREGSRSLVSLLGRPDQAKRLRESAASL